MAGRNTRTENDAPPADDASSEVVDNKANELRDGDGEAIDTEAVVTSDGEVEAAERDVPDSSGRNALGENVLLGADEFPELDEARSPAAALSWRPVVGDIVYAKVGETAAGKPQVVAAMITRVLGQLPSGHRGWGVNVTAFGDGGATDGIANLALFGGPDDAKKANPSGPVGWVRRDGGR